MRATLAETMAMLGSALGPWKTVILPGCVCALALYVLIVRNARYQRMRELEAPFANGKRPLSSMTTAEAEAIIEKLQTLEFPAAFAKARKIALLKAGAIPTMSKLFIVTGQNTERNAGRRSVDTEILLREAQSNPRDDKRYQLAVARMNYLHERYRKAGKILDKDLLHTLGDGLAEIHRVIDSDEWRPLTDVEKCALGIFHQNLGEDMEIPFDVLSRNWRDGMHFGEELVEWTVRYEKEAAVPTDPSDKYVRVYVDSALAKMPSFVRMTVRKTLAFELDDIMRTALNLEEPGPIHTTILLTIRTFRKFYLRNLALPRPDSKPVKILYDQPNPQTGLFNFYRKTLQPWYVESNFWTRYGPSTWLIRAFGGRVPVAKGDKYYPQGYDLYTIGPEPQKGKGVEHMDQTTQAIKERVAASCPFSARLGKE